MNSEILKPESAEQKSEANEDNNELAESFDLLDKPISRRKFFKMAGLGIAGAAAGASFPSLYEGVWNTLGKEELEKTIKELETELSKKYGIRVEVWEKHPMDRPTGTISESLKDHSMYRAYKSIMTLKDVLAHYPPRLISDNVNGISIVHSVRPQYSDTIAEGATPEAVTSFGGTITIRAGYQSAMSYKAIFGEVLDSYVLHHEIAHTLTDDIPREEWQRLHPDAEYVGLEWTRYKKEGTPKGFAMPYSTQSLSEDIATTAELLFSDPDELGSITENDEIIRAKVNYLKKWYETKSDGEMGEQYWRFKAH